jgi:hypothetical protein
MYEALPGADRFDDDGSVNPRTAKQLFYCCIFGMHKE